MTAEVMARIIAAMATVPRVVSRESSRLLVILQYTQCILNLCEASLVSTLEVVWYSAPVHNILQGQILAPFIVIVLNIGRDSESSQRVRESRHTGCPLLTHASSSRPFLADLPRSTSRCAVPTEHGSVKRSFARSFFRKDVAASSQTHTLRCRPNSLPTKMVI